MKHKIIQKTKFNINNSVEGETIEQKVERFMNNKEPITDGAPIIYQPRNEGVRPEFDIRTDRFEIALDATDNISRSKLAKRVNLYEESKADGKTNEDGKAKSIQATE